MTKKNVFRKSLVIGIIVLFIGVNIVQSISGDLEKTSSERNVNENDVTSSPLTANIVSPDDVVQYSEAVTLSSETSSIQEEEIIDKLASVPLFFTENKGQFPEEVLFQTHLSGATVYLCRDRIVSVFSRIIEEESDEKYVLESIHMDINKQFQMESLSVVAKFVDANMDAIVVGEDVLAHYNNYFIGNDPDKWYIDVSTYKSVWYKDIYPGIDLHYYGDDDSLKYDFIVSPRANPDVIGICYEGVEDMELTPVGDLQMQTQFASIYEKMPVLYQEIDGVIHEVSGRYEIRKPDVFGFVVDGSYNPLYPLVIDPQLVYSTFLGGTSHDYGQGIVVDDSGCAYVSGNTFSADFPTVNAYDDSYNGGYDCFVTKFSASGGSLLYSTYFGGADTENENHCGGIAVDDSGCAYVSGNTFSADFPTVNAYDDSYNGGYDCFVTKFSASGNSLLYSTYLGGIDNDYSFGGIAVDDNGCAYVTGYTRPSVYGNPSDFPTVNAYDDSHNDGWDCFVTKFSTSGNSLVFSTFLGGSSNDYGISITVDESSCVYVTGLTDSFDFPTVNAYDDSHNGWKDCFVTKFSTSGDSLVYSTYLGGTDSDGVGGDSGSIVVDDSGCLYVTGLTESSDFPTMNAYDDSHNGWKDCFVTKFSTSGDSLDYSTYLGGTNVDIGYGIAIDDYGCAYVAGDTVSTNFPKVNAYDDGHNGGYDCFVTKISASGGSLLYSTFLGGTSGDYSQGIAVDDSGCAYVTGVTQSSDFPTMNAYDDSHNGGNDCFVTKFSPYGENPPVANFTYFVDDRNVVFNASSSYDIDGIIVNYVWNFGDDESGTGMITRHMYADYGNYSVTLNVTDNDGLTDNISKNISLVDEKLPEIYDFQAKPPNQHSGGYVNISANVTDDGGLADVRLIIRYPDDSLENFSILQNKTEDTYYCNRTYDMVGTYFSQIWAIDLNNNSANSSTIEIEIIEEFIADADGPYYGSVDEPIQFNGYAVGGAPPYSWYWEFGDGDTSYEQNPTHAYENAGNYTVTLFVTDSTDGPNSTVSDTTWALIQDTNHPPGAPDIDGPPSGKPEMEYDYIFNSEDPDDDDVKYHIDWGDGNSETTDYNPSGTNVLLKHTWSEEGTYTIRATAEDTYGLMGLESTMTVTMPRNRLLSNTLFMRFLEQFPTLEKIILKLQLMLK